MKITTTAVTVLAADVHDGVREERERAAGRHGTRDDRGPGPGRGPSCRDT